MVNPGTMTGRDVCRLMARHHMTIKGLAEAMGITQKRIREVRRDGLSVRTIRFTAPPIGVSEFEWKAKGTRSCVRDWIQGITGRDPGE